MDEKLARILGLPTEAEKAAQREQFEAKLKELFLNTQPDTSGADLLRTIVESVWCVATKPDIPLDVPLTKESFETITVAPGKHRLAFSSEEQSKKSKSKDGKGGCFLPLFLNAQNQASRQLDGRSLVRILPDNLSGLLLHLPDQSPKELGNEYFPDLFGLADAVALEDMMLHPAADQLEMVKNATWLVETEKGALRIDSTDKGEFIHAYTHRDRAGWTNHELKAMTGEALFRCFAESSAADGVVVNRYRVLEHKGDSLNAPVLSPGFACGLIHGKDTRPGAHPLPARNAREIELWLQLHRFPLEGIKLIDAPYPEGPLVRAKSPLPSTWRMQETMHENRINNDDCTWSPVFVLPPLERLKMNSGTESEIAPGPTRILCAGLLAKALHASFSDAKDPERTWRPGRNFLIARYVPKWAREHSQHRLTLANELLKLIPPDADTVPRSAILTVEGATLIRKHPHAAQRAWIEATARQAERFTRQWVWNG